MTKERDKAHAENTALRIELNQMENELAADKPIIQVEIESYHAVGRRTPPPKQNKTKERLH